jgi:predicted N-acyltransferase
VIIDATPGDQLVTPDWKWFHSKFKKAKKTTESEPTENFTFRATKKILICMIDHTNSFVDSSLLILYHTELHGFHTGMLRFHTNLCIHTDL